MSDAGGLAPRTGEGNEERYAVIFSNLLAEAAEGYDETAARMVELAGRQPGFLGVESVRGADGLGITVSYWRTRADIEAWRRQVEHTEARRRGRTEWYRAYRLRVARIERELTGPGP